MNPCGVEAIAAGLLEFRQLFALLAPQPLGRAKLTVSESRPNYAKNGH